MTSNQRDFKGIWIPANVWLDQRLTYFERCLLADIHSLNGPKGCFASNTYLCEFFQENERKIQAGLAKLKEYGYIYQESFDGRTRVLRTNMEPKTDNTLFNTSEVRKENDNTLFNTSGVSDSVNPSYSIDNKGDNKEKQQQQEVAGPAAPAAASFQKRESKQAAPQQPSVYELLKDIDIPEPDKLWISKRYDANTVRNAIAWSRHPQTKISTTMAQAIKWACQNKPEVPKSALDEIAENKAYVMRFDGMTNGTAKITVCNRHVEITNNGANGGTILEYTQRGFKEQFLNALRKNNLKILE